MTSHTIKVSESVWRVAPSGGVIVKKQCSNERAALAESLAETKEMRATGSSKRSVLSSADDDKAAASDNERHAHVDMDSRAARCIAPATRNYH